MIAVVLLVWLATGLAITGSKVIKDERLLAREGEFDACAVTMIVASKWTAALLCFASVLAAIAWFDPLYTSLAQLTLAVTPGLVIALVANSLRRRGFL